MNNIGTLVFSVIGGAFTNGFWPGTAPDQTPAPYGTYLHFGTPNVFLPGRGTDQNQRFQIDVYHNSYDEAAQLADQIEQLMEAQSIDFSPSSFTATPINREYFGLDPDVPLHRIMLEYSLWYRP